MPNWVTGFSDGESSFCILATKCSDYKTGWRVIPTFSIELNNKDLPLLYKIKEYFRVGRINSAKKNKSLFAVSSIKDLNNVIIPHFEKYPLLTTKKLSFIYFKNILSLMKDKKHLNPEGLHIIMSTRGVMNNQNFVAGYERPLLEIPKPLLPKLNKTDITPEWLAGFTDAEGCFFF